MLTGRIYAEAKAEHYRVWPLIAPYWPRMLFQCKVKHYWGCFVHALGNVFLLGNLRETTKPGDKYRSYAPARQAHGTTEIA